MTTRNTITRAALAAALLGLAGFLIWVGVTRATGDQAGTLILLASLVPVVATGLLFIRRGIGAALAVLAALLGALVGVGLSFCLCSAPITNESIVLFVLALVVLALALVELLTSGLAWVALLVAVAVFVFLFSSNLPILAVGLAVAAVIAWLLLRGRRSGSGT